MLKIYCDGACGGNPGPGGWAFVIPERNIEQSGYEPDTTNNRMEITAVYKALKYLYDHLINLGEDVEIITDSQYVVNTMTQGWKKNKNQDLWAYIDDYKYYFTNIKWAWVKGHASNEHNNKCDKLAVAEYKMYQALCEEKDEEKKRELEWYGEKIDLDPKEQKIRIEFSPYEKWMIGKGHHVLIFKDSCGMESYVAEADNKELLCIGDYQKCKQAIQAYKQAIKNIS